MTVEQIVRALECCTTKGKSCKECPAFVKVDRSKCRQYFIAALELIKRQQEEIERLKEKDLSDTKRFMITSENYIRNETIKEFAKRLKQRFLIVDFAGITFDAVAVKAIDNLVKEMAGEDNGTL